MRCAFPPLTAKSRSLVNLVAPLVLVLAAASCQPAPSSVEPTGQTPPEGDFAAASMPRDEPILTRFGLPLLFEANVGQSDPQVRYLARRPGYALFLTDDAIVATLGGHGALGPDPRTKPEPGNTGDVVRMLFADANDGVEPAGKIKRKGRASNYIGGNPNGAQKLYSLFQAVLYEQVYPGIDFLLYDDDGAPRYAFELRGDADIRRIRMRFDGAQELGIEANGNLIVKTAGGPIVHTAPQFREEVKGTSQPLEGSFVLLDDLEVGFTVSKRTPGARLIIDPQIVFSTYYGGSEREQHLDISASADMPGQVFVTGSTQSADFPTTTGPGFEGDSDVFAMRLDLADPTAPEVDYATFIGGSVQDTGGGVAAASDGTAYFAGTTTSMDFWQNVPSAALDGVFQPNASSGSYRGFIARLDGDGTVTRGTYIGTSHSEFITAVQVDETGGDTHAPGVYTAGFSWVSGQDDYTGLATAGVAQGTHSEDLTDGTAAKLDLDLTGLQYYTFLGGSGSDNGSDLAVQNGQAFIVGGTASIDFQPIRSYTVQDTHSLATEADNGCSVGDGQHSHHDCYDGFLVRLNEDASEFIYGTYYGGPFMDWASGVDVGAEAIAHGVGYVRTADEPNADRAYALTLSALAGTLINEWVFYEDQKFRASGVAVDSMGRVHLAGIGHGDVPIAENEYGGGLSDAFYARITPDGTPDYFGFVGGNWIEIGAAIDTDTRICVYIATGTASSSAELVNPIQEEPGGPLSDIMLAMFCDVPELAISKSGPESAAVGDTVTYTVAVTNLTQAPATDITLTDFLPANLEVQSVSDPVSGDCTVNPDTNTVECVGLAVSGASLEIEITALVTDCGPAANVAVLTSDDFDPISDDAVTSVDANCPEPDLTLVKTGPESAAVGDTVTYTITVTNPSSTPVTGIAISDALPAILDAQATTTSSGGCTITEATNTVTCAGLEADGAPIVVTITAVVTECGIATNAAAMTIDGQDPVSDSAVTVIEENCAPEPEPEPDPVPQPELTLEKTGPSTATPGQDVTYTVRLTNVSAIDAVGVDLTDTLSLDLTMNGAGGLGGTGCVPNFQTGEIVCEDLTIPAGATFEFTMTMRAQCGSWNNQVHVQLPGGGNLFDWVTTTASTGCQCDSGGDCGDGLVCAKTCGLFPDCDISGFFCSGETLLCRPARCLPTAANNPPFFEILP